MEFYIKWILDATGDKVKRVEELKTGKVYLNLISKMFPGSIKNGISINSNDNSIENLSLLQEALIDLKVQKVVQIEDLLSKDGFTANKANKEFVTWFHTFYTQWMKEKLKNSFKITNQLRRDRDDIYENLEELVGRSDDVLHTCSMLLTQVSSSVLDGCRVDRERFAGKENFDKMQSALLSAVKAQKIAEQYKFDHDFFKAVKDMYRDVLKAGHFGLEIKEERKNRSKSDKIVETVDEVVSAAHDFIAMTREAVMKSRKNSDNIKTCTEAKLSKSLQDVKNSLRLSAEAAGDIEDEEMRFGRTSPERVMWRSFHEARIVAQAILQIYPN